MDFLSYTYPCDALYTGASLGNRRAFARLDRFTQLQGIWCSLDNQFYVGSWEIALECDGKALGPRTTVFAPESQMTTWSAGTADAELLFFLPVLKESIALLQSAHYLVTLRNHSDHSARFTLRHDITFPGVPSGVFTKQPSPDQMEKRVVIEKEGTSWYVTTVGSGEEARIAGGSLEPENWTADDRKLSVVYAFNVAPGEEQSAHFAVAFSPRGLRSALGIYQDSCDGPALLSRTRDAYRALLATATLHTPEPLINRAFVWAKVNTLRVQHEYRSGPGFTNDPPQDIVVIRDLAWYVLGADYLTPLFCRGLITFAERFGYHEGGKLTEYLHADEPSPEQHDYRLNINDDTPLFVLALWHHALVARDRTLLARFYPLMKRASEWILSQRQDGLVYARADGTSVWGIASWRNIIADYNLTGAVTEINAECYYALRLTAQAASLTGNSADARRFEHEADSLKQAIREQLVSPRTGTYLLTRRDRTRVDDVLTGDLVFPLLFDAAEGEARERALELLLSPSFWTPFGVRTVHPDESSYDPDFGYQLVGGVWPNLTAWVALAARHVRPGIVAEAMINVYRQSESERPADYVNVVPGEFPERLHGETFVSRGMAMSPWMPATYLWLGIEGLVGFTPGVDTAFLEPSLPPGWRWFAVSDLPFRDERISLVLFENVLYTSSRSLRTKLPVRYGTLLDAVASPESVTAIAFLVENEVALFAAADHDVAATIAVVLPLGSREVPLQLKAGEAQLLFLDPSSLREKTPQ